MSHQTTIETVRQTLDRVFQAVDAWFDVEPEIRSFKPTKGWTIDEVLEHISLTNHFLMMTLTKQLKVAEKRAARGDLVKADASDLAAIEVIGQRGSFVWRRPDHMEPTGEATSEEVRARLHSQRVECHQLLDRMPNGIGSLVVVTMSVNDLGKIDLYQWLYFLAKHAERHLDQIIKIRDQA